MVTKIYIFTNIIKITVIVDTNSLGPKVPRDSSLISKYIFSILLMFGNLIPYFTILKSP